jgi:uncharacterized protein YidB (DUF937 family)
MAKNDRDLFDRLRQAGLRKQVAKRLSEIGEGAGKQAVRAARGAASELRLMADEIERRLPATAPGDGKRAGAVASATTPSASAPARAATTRRSTTRRRTSATGARTQRTAARRNGAQASQATASARAPRGQNKAKILESLTAGPKTASQIAAETGIGTRTVGSTLTKLAGTGEVVKAPRGYALPKR